MVCGNLFLAILVVLLDLNWYRIAVLNMLGRWKAGPRPEDGVWAPYWYSAVHKSTEFTPPPPFSNKV